MQSRIVAHDSLIRPQNHKAALAWSSGGHGYEAISRQIADAIEHAVERLALRPGDRVLDVATGTGWGARRAAARGARVTGVDIGGAVIDAARELARGLEIEFQVADAEELPFADASFDAVLSTFGVMFCGDPEAAAAELARVCRAGGRIALATWAPEGGVLEMFKVIKAYRPPPPGAPPPSPFEWGNTQRIVELFGNAFDLGFEEATSYYREPDPEAAWCAFSTGYGPVVTLLSTLDGERAAALRRDFIAMHARYRTGCGVLVPRQYLITTGVRR